MEDQGERVGQGGMKGREMYVAQDVMYERRGKKCRPNENYWDIWLEMSC